mmetsp:Transcript_43717/g.98765  ORF Transcript_43717/g.98765 Transcript_43717/m.98765 type:complete len:217 (+) Transcript_43717:474-1124(+)
MATCGEPVSERLIGDPSVAAAEVLQVDVPEQGPLHDTACMRPRSIRIHLAMPAQELVARLLQHRSHGLACLGGDGVPSNCVAVSGGGATKDGSLLRQHPAVARLLLGVGLAQAPQEVEELAARPVVAPGLSESHQAGGASLWRVVIVAIVRRQPADTAQCAVENSAAKGQWHVAEVHHGPEDHGPHGRPHLPPLLRAELGLLPIIDEECWHGAQTV